MLRAADGQCAIDFTLHTAADARATPWMLGWGLIIGDRHGQGTAARQPRSEEAEKGKAEGFGARLALLKAKHGGLFNKAAR
jgi:hypothetical protein